MAKDIANVLIKFASDGKTKAISSPDLSPTTHTVVSGDSLSKIAMQYKTTVPDLMRINNLRNDMIRIGQSLLLK